MARVRSGAWIGVLGALASACTGEGVVGPVVADGAARDASVTADGASLDATATDALPPEPADPCAVRYPSAVPASRAQSPWEGSFVRVPALEAWLAASTTLPFTHRPDSVTSALIADLDGDGRDDVLFNDHRDFCGGPNPASSTWLLRQGPSGALEAPVRDGTYRNCIAAADLDGDGRLDLVCSSDRGPVVRWGGAAGFTREAETPVSISMPAMAITPWDVDRDGATDLVVASWQGASRVFQNRRGRRFEDVTSRWGLDAVGHAWCAGFVDLDAPGDGAPELYIGEDGARHENRAMRLDVDPSSGEPRVVRYRPTSQACDRTGYFGTSDDSPMGVALGDLDRDGRMEFALATAPTMRVLSQRSVAPFHWLDVASRLSIDRRATTSGSFLVPWSPTFWDVDHDGWLDLVLAHGDDQGFASMGNRGESLLRLLRGAPGGTFTEPRTGAEADGQFATVHLGDLDHDGDLDLIAGRFGDPPFVFENRVRSPFRHVLVSLRGRVSNPEGRGARIVTASRVHPVGDRFPPWSAPQPVVDVALGDAASDELTVRWPSGCVQRVTGPFTDATLTVTEPAWLTVDPAEYTVRAGSDARITVTVDPALLDASAPHAARVDLDDLAGVAVWEGAAETLPDGRVRRVLRAGATAGSVALRVTVDGRVLPAHPRVWFE